MFVGFQPTLDYFDSLLGEKFHFNPQTGYISTNHTVQVRSSRLCILFKNVENNITNTILIYLKYTLDLALEILFFIKFNVISCSSRVFTYLLCSSHDMFTCT